MEGALLWGLAVSAAFCIGLARGGAPSIGTLAVPLLALVISPLTAAGLLLPVLIFADVFALWTYRKFIDLRLIRIAIPGILIGTAVGWGTAHLVSDAHVRVIVGGIGLVFSLNFLFRSMQVDAARAPNVAAGVFWTTIAGFTSFVSHAGAPPWQVWALPLKLPKLVFAGTTTAVFAIMNVLKVGPYYTLGQLQPQSLAITATLFVPALAGVAVSYWLIRVVPERVFYAAVTVMLFALSLKLIWDGIGGV